MVGRFVILGAVFLASAASHAPSAMTVAAWEKYVAQTEAELERARTSPVPPRPGGITATGDTIDIGAGTISHWRGTVFIRGVAVDQLLDRLQFPGTPPPQDDVVSARVVGRTADSLQISMRLVRHAIVTVTYDTEHCMTFHRWSPVLATARSVATRIDEVGGGDHGFVWRLRSYWRYDQLQDGVVVGVEALTLSRDVPAIVKPFVAHIITRVARESMERTLEALKRYVE
ncbi:MAG TPA: hypothetical protein VGY48_03520 [Vicinamibacterales bacterium]|nr:hypothetical protein [Vicinamibacterales bacterium]